MLANFAQKLFGSRGQRIIKRLRKQTLQIQLLESELNKLSDDALAAKTAEFKQRIAEGANLDDILVEAFAVVREGGRRFLSMRHFDVQLIGGMVLHQHKIAEMQTGEGKTLVATLPAYLNALSGQGVHVITVNDYLAQRDANWMRPLYEGLGLSVGVIVSGLEGDARREAYAADITYGTNNEFGFDYLRDNMAFSSAEKVQRSLNFAIVDEVDSILIDEARTPLIISGPAEDSSELYRTLNTLIPKLVRGKAAETPDDQPTGDYTVDEKSRQVHLTEQGQENSETLLLDSGLLQEGDSLYNVGNVILLHHLHAALRAHALFKRDIDYIVRDDQVIIVDEHTGRTMAGRRWGDGLHQAVEAKEGVSIQNESQTLASITYQNYFRLYNKLAGMTGTADTEAYEFQSIYGLEVVPIPTNKPSLRKDLGDLVFLTLVEKYKAIIEDITEQVKQGRPVLVGTASIESSELLSKALNQAKIKHQVLNAKFHAKEAQIIAQAGQAGAVTIATNMAGRGTDIVLGGNKQALLDALEDPSDAQLAEVEQQWQQAHDQVIAAGGLHIIGTERHESRRIDNQLRGRCARQGDPGSTRFYLALEDNLMRIFASGKLGGLMQRIGMQEGEAIEHPWVSRAIENAQKKVEGHNFDMRKQILEYDDVANDQRKEIYDWRSEIMSVESMAQTITVIRRDVMNSLISEYIPPQSIDEQWDIPGLEQRLQQDLSLELPVAKWLEEDRKLYEEPLRDKILEAAEQAYQDKADPLGEEMRRIEKGVLLMQLDAHWKEHLASMDQLRQGIHLRSYAQKNPKQEYKRESFELFQQMLERLKYNVIMVLQRLQIRHEDAEQIEAQRRDQANQPLEYTRSNEPATEPAPAEGEPVARPQRSAKQGRNSPCACGSGKKYKHCCGRLD